MTTETIVDTMVDRIVARFQPARILLFGSRARGTDNRWSDVDLLVVMEEVADKRRTAVEISRVLSDLPVGKDIVVTTPGGDRASRSPRRQRASRSVARRGRRV